MNGAVIQTVFVSKTDVSTFSSTSYDDIPGMSAIITPKFSNSLIMIRVTLSGQHNTASNSFRLMRDSTPIGLGDLAGNRTRATNSSLYI